MDQEKVGKFIAEMRKEKKLTQEDIAEHFGITSQAVSKWERGVNAPDISILKDLAQILGVEVVEILNGERSNTKKESNINDTMIKSIEFYENRTKMKYSKICYFISLVFLLSISLVLFLYGINNYNRIKVYTINSNDVLSMNGKIMFNPKQKCLIISRLYYNDANTGTDLELKIKGINIKIANNEKIIMETGNLDFVDTNEIKSINDYLSDFSIVDMETFDNDKDYIKEEDINKLKIILEYADEQGRINELEYSIESYKEFSNTEIFY